MQSSTGRWEMHFALSSAAVHWCWVTTHQHEQHCSGQNPFPTVLQCCFAKQAHSMHCFSAHTPVETCCSCWCEVIQHQCTAALVLAKPIPHCPLLLCKTGSQHALCQRNNTYGDLLFMLVRKDSAPIFCCTAQGKMHSPLSSAALQNRLTT